jgi:S1-C subfamily serine protease
MRILARSVVRPLVLVLAPILLAAAPAFPQSLRGIREEFAKIGERGIPSTVIVRAIGRAPYITGSSGMIVTEDGYVLSDADAALLKFEAPKEGETTQQKVHGTDVEVIMPEPDRRVFRAVVVRRDAETDTTLIRIVDESLKGKLPCVPLGVSSGLAVGSFTVVVGNAFGLGTEGKPALTMGVVSALVPRPEREGGRYAKIYTSAAVNPGNNGGPVLDAEGFVVGVVSSFVTEPESPYRALGIVTPIDLVRPRYKGVEDYDRIFPPSDARPARSDDAFILEEAFGIVARHARSALASIEVTREGAKGVIERLVPNRENPRQPLKVQIPRYPGPYSGVIITADGWILTSTEGLWEFDTIKSLDVHLSDGRVRPGKVVARDRYRRLALVKIDLEGLRPLLPAEGEDLEVGRFALALGNPYGAEPHDAPLLTFGIISGLHRLGNNRPWLDAIQTDAGMNDGMIGGALVTLDGKLLGLNVLVDPAAYGRNSGIGFAVPLSSIRETLPQLMAGETVEPGWTGIESFMPNPEGHLILGKLADGCPMFKAGLKPGDRLLEVGGKDVEEFDDLQQLMLTFVLKHPGDQVTVKIRRGTVEKEVEVTLAPFPES